MIVARIKGGSPQLVQVHSVLELLEGGDRNGGGRDPLLLNPVRLADMVPA